MEFRVFEHFASVAEQVMVKELLFHFALQEGFHCLFEIGLVSLVDKEVEFMAVVVGEVSVLLVGAQSVPLFDKVEYAELAGVCSFDLSYFAEDLRHLGKIVNNLHLG
jgi:hypothetical protein